VLRHDVSPDANVKDIKALIKGDYDADPSQAKALLLFGRIPVPYSGDISPDGRPNHQGAWRADVYYGDMHGLWTDSSVTSTNAERTRNWNVPGDGKFDQDSPPGGVDLEVGRVDLSNMTCFSNKTPSRSETDLLRQWNLFQCQPRRLCLGELEQRPAASRAEPVHFPRGRGGAAQHYGPGGPGLQPAGVSRSCGLNDPHKRRAFEPGL
jgi:hypothetical protein